MFHRLIKDIHFHRSVIADQLVVNMHRWHAQVLTHLNMFHRWICDPNSLLFNPAIRNALATLMRKLCLLLVAEIQRLGGTVVHCSFGRLVLSTNR